MKQEMYIALFIKFLKENNVYSEYKELWADNRKSLVASPNPKEWLFKANTCNYLFSAFSWPSDCWCQLHKRWLRLIEKSEKMYIRHGKELRTTRSI
jgi:hypothetical protein